jgi:hypothetical protein
VVNLLEYADKRITVTFLDEGENRTISGLVTKANVRAILVRPKGKPLVLVDVESIASIQETDDPVKVPRVKVRSMEKILPASIRQHLADRHGVMLFEIPDSDAEAEKMHDLLDHGKLGHHHRPDAIEVAERAAVLDGEPVVDIAVEAWDGNCPHAGVECDKEGCVCNCSEYGCDFESDDVEREEI